MLVLYACFAIASCVLQSCCSIASVLWTSCRNRSIPEPVNTSRLSVCHSSGTRTGAGSSIRGSGTSMSAWIICDGMFPRLPSIFCCFAASSSSPTDMLSICSSATEESRLNGFSSRNFKACSIRAISRLMPLISAAALSGRTYICLAVSLIACCIREIPSRRLVIPAIRCPLSTVTSAGTVTASLACSEMSGSGTTGTTSTFMPRDISGISICGLTVGAATPDIACSS